MKSGSPSRTTAAHKTQTKIPGLVLSRLPLLSLLLLFLPKLLRGTRDRWVAQVSFIIIYSTGLAPFPRLSALPHSSQLVWILFHCEEFLCGVRSVSFITCLCYWWGAAGLHLGPNFVCIIYAPSSLHFWVSQGPISHLCGWYPVVHVNQTWVYVLIRLACLRKLHKKLDGWYIFFS